MRQRAIQNAVKGDWVVVTLYTTHKDNQTYVHVYGPYNKYTAELRAAEMRASRGELDPNVAIFVRQQQKVD